MVVVRNADGSYNVALGLLEQRIVNKVGLWWEGANGQAPATDAEVVRLLLTLALDRARKRLGAMDAGAIANAYAAADPATKTKAETDLGVTPLS